MYFLSLLYTVVHITAIELRSVCIITPSSLVHCLSAFDGTFCEEDRNGCSEIECFEGVECMDVPAPGVGAVCGSCPPGYTGDAQKCYG